VIEGDNFLLKYLGKKPIQEGRFDPAEEKFFHKTGENIPGNHSIKEKPDMKTKPAMIVNLMIFLAAACFVTGVGAADYPIITAKDLKAKMDAGEKLLLIHPMSDIEFQEAHIPGSVNIPLDTFGTTDKLPTDKGMLIVTYCKGPKCIFYSLGAEALVKMGYTQVMGFKGGMPEWAQAGFPLTGDKELAAIQVPNIKVDELKSVVDKVAILDIRVPNMYEMGWIKGSIKIPLTQLSAKYGQIPKDKTVVVVDHLGQQVVSAGRFLKSKGYKDVHFLQGGLMGWVSKGYPMEK